MSQQIIPIVSIQEDVAEMGDLEFIQTKVEANDYFHVIADISDPANKAIKVVDSGRTAFLIEAKITMFANPAAVAAASAGTPTINDQVIATLQKNINSVITPFSRAKVGIAAAAAASQAGRSGSGSGFGTDGNGQFNVLGFSLVGDGINQIEIVNTTDNGNASAEFSGYLV